MASLADLLQGVSGDSRLEDIIRLRMQLAGNQAAQDQLGPMDHQAFARQSLQDVPVYVRPLRALSLGLAIPVYEGKKALGLGDRDSMTSNPSLASMLSGYKGIWQGLTQ